MTFASMRMESCNSETKFSTSARFSYRDRCGVTLLELLIALGVLSVLMIVAWSLFDNLQKAEERSGGLARRVQLLRQSRAWLVADMDQLETAKGERIASLNPPVVPQFNGDPTGFVASITTSLNPLPFLQGAFASSDEMEDVEGAELSVFDTEEQRQVNQARESIWPADKLNVEYRLEPESPLDNSASALGVEEDILFRLVRREFLHGEASNASGSNGMPPNVNSTATAADRQLTIRDLYRQTDDTLELGSAALREKELTGFSKASFRYFDGRAWQEDWNSREEGGPPHAIALQFDFPSRAAARRSKEQSRSAVETEIEEDTGESQNNTIDTLLAQQPKATRETEDADEFLVATATSELTIVVATHSGPAKRANDPGTAPSIEQRR
ncbi:MAG: prepilin-type N-terminal cleavage/methylation domain-containing protein [Planctomycetota bacterium]|nr:prepilin-type N-terminal cleavage/methylation domain-containing protein [Planctomycetota bacterium]